jgi:predicted short-subunit dehydrogenase-like oxidoreductase (DUF2520 family)
MQIVIIGTGNTATVLGLKLKEAGNNIAQVYGRNPAAAAALAEKLKSAYSSEWNAITQNADLYIIAIADKALPEVAAHLKLKDQLVVHSAGAVSIKVLKDVSTNYGVFYPFQTIRKEVLPIPEIPMMIDASSVAAKETLLNLAKTISKKVSIANDEERMQYHLCAVIANNFSNFIYTLTENYCKQNSLDFSNLLPLIDETAGRLHHFSPRTVQTGPAIRKDLATIEHHLSLLKNDPALKEMYRFFSERMIEFDWS